MYRVNFRLKGLENLLVKWIITVTVMSNPFPHLWHMGSLRYFMITGGWTTAIILNMTSLLTNVYCTEHSVTFPDICLFLVNKCTCTKTVTNQVLVNLETVSYSQIAAAAFPS
jgi:hypothetical protein